MIIYYYMINKKNALLIKDSKHIYEISILIILYYLVYYLKYLLTKIYNNSYKIISNKNNLLNILHLKVQYI